MRWIVAGVLFGWTALTTLPVLADEAIGVIEELDTYERILRFENGQEFEIARQVPLAGLSEGTRVAISFEENDDGRRVIRAIVPAGPFSFENPLDAPVSDDLPTRDPDDR